MTMFYHFINPTTKKNDINFVTYKIFSLELKYESLEYACMCYIVLPPPKQKKKNYLL